MRIGALKPTEANESSKRVSGASGVLDLLLENAVTFSTYSSRYTIILEAAWVEYCDILYELRTDIETTFF